MDKKFIMPTINKIEGHKTRLKELHWSSPSHSIHVIVDDFSDELAKFEDDFVENSSALLGFIYPGELNPELPEETEFEADLESIRGILSGIKSECSEEMMWSGIINLVDDFWTTVNKYIYLAKISKHEAKI